MLSNNNKRLRASDLKSLKRNVIMQVLFPALSLFIAGNKVFQLHINQFELALFNTEQNFLIYPSPLEKNSSYVSGVSVCIFVAFFCTDVCCRGQ